MPVEVHARAGAIENARSPANLPLRHLETGELLVIGAAVAIVRHV
jgi:hypothetical protein